MGFSSFNECGELCFYRFTWGNKQTIYYMMSLFLTYFIGVVVGVVLDNLFWYGYAKMKEMDDEWEAHKINGSFTDACACLSLCWFARSAWLMDDAKNSRPAKPDWLFTKTH